jgi:hypothetical protein
MLGHRRLAMAFDRDAAAVAVGHGLAAGRSAGRLVPFVVLPSRAVKFPAQRLCRGGGGRAPGVTDIFAVLRLAILALAGLLRPRWRSGL